MRNDQIQKSKISSTHIEHQENVKSPPHSKNHKPNEQTEEFMFIKDERTEEEKDMQSRVAD
jgi:hypothetical protein